VEVKNYNIATNSNELVNNIVQQAIDRQANLPAGMRQEVLIDIRGQVVSQAQRDSIKVAIADKSGGIISRSQITFKDR
jgi:filamentous hemagglutinin